MSTSDCNVHEPPEDVLREFGLELKGYRIKNVNVYGENCKGCEKQDVGVVLVLEASDTEGLLICLRKSGSNWKVTWVGFDKYNGRHY